MNAGCEEERDENTQLCPDCRTNTMPDTTPLVSPRDMYPDNPVSAAAVMHDLFTEASLAGLRGTPLPELNPDAGERDMFDETINGLEAGERNAGASPLMFDETINEPGERNSEDRHRYHGP